MRRFAVRSLGSTISLIVFALVVSGCFKADGAPLPSTPTGGDASPVAIGSNPTSAAPPATIDPAIFALQTQTAVALLSTPQTPQGPIIVTGVPPTDASLPSQPTLTPSQVIPPTAQPLPTDSGPIIAPTLTFTPVPPTLTPSFTPIPSATPTLEPTQPPPPTVVVQGASATPTLFVPTAAPGVAVAQGVDPTQAAMATNIVIGITQTANVRLTMTATALGTGIPAGAPTVAQPIVVTPGGPATAQNPAVATATTVSGEPSTGAGGPVTTAGKYTVITGDRMYRIALRFGLQPDALARFNGIVNMDLIVPGQVLTIPNYHGPAVGSTLTPTPGAAATAVTQVPGAPTPNPTASPNPNSGQTYIVKEGDTLFAIAMNYKVTLTALAQFNNIANPNLIFIGQKILIP